VYFLQFIQYFPDFERQRHYSGAAILAEYSVWPESPRAQTRKPGV
jgi:hypothetical protein